MPLLPSKPIRARSWTGMELQRDRTVSKKGAGELESYLSNKQDQLLRRMLQPNPYRNRNSLAIVDGSTLEVTQEQVGFSGNIPLWLDSLFQAEFSNLCNTHVQLKQNEKNIFCLDCCHCFCSNCSPRHFGHRVLQIRKYDVHRVVKTEDIEKLINCSTVQSYILNRAQVVFLKARSPNKKKERAQNEAQSSTKRGRSLKQNFPNCCSSCPRTIKEGFDYCSISCMVKQVLKTKGNLVGHLRQFPPLPLNPKEADEELVPADLIHGGPATTGSMIKGAGRADSLKGKKKNNEKPSPSALIPMQRRKGVPMRSPFF